MRAVHTSSSLLVLGNPSPRFPSTCITMRHPLPHVAPPAESTPIPAADVRPQRAKGDGQTIQPRPKGIGCMQPFSATDQDGWPCPKAALPRARYRELMRHAQTNYGLNPLYPPVQTPSGPLSQGIIRRPQKAAAPLALISAVARAGAWSMLGTYRANQVRMKLEKCVSQVFFGRGSLALLAGNPGQWAAPSHMTCSLEHHRQLLD